MMGGPKHEALLAALSGINWQDKIEKAIELLAVPMAAVLYQLLREAVHSSYYNERITPLG